MHPTPPPTAPKRQGPPSLATLKNQRIAQGPKAPAGPAKSKGPTVKLTPEQQAKKAAEDAETKRKEQEKIVAINDEWKGKLNEGEKDEVLRAAARNGKTLVVNDVIQPCGKRTKPMVLNCLPGDTKLIVGMSKEMTDAVTKSQEAKRKAAGTKIKIDYAQVSEWEGGSYTGGYVPWGPVLQPVHKDIGEKDKPHNVTIFVPDTTKNKATGQTTPSMRGISGNNSGVTIGAGVDFGSKTDSVQRKAIKNSAKESGLLTDAEADALADKVKPYYGLKRTEACQYLRKHPLNLSQKEVEVLNYESFMSQTDEVIRQYEGKAKKLSVARKNWTDLTEEEQTFLFSHKYHHGNVNDIAADVGNYESNGVLKPLEPKTILVHGKLKKVPAAREYEYMKSFYGREAAAGTANAKAYAARQAARKAASLKAVVPKTASDSLRLGH